MAKAVGLFGVSGVGKSHMAREYTSSAPDVLHVTASSLLNKARDMSSGDLRVRNTAELKSNQELIIWALDKIRSEFPNNKIIFDGHLVLDTDHGLKAIELSVFRKLDLAGYIHLVEPNIEALVRRRLNDKKRDRPVRLVEYLREYQSKSIALCKDYALALGRPQETIHAGDTNALSLALDELM